MKLKARLRIEYGCGCLVGLVTPILFLFTYIIRDTHVAIQVVANILFFALWFSVFLVTSSAISVLFNILEARRRIRDKKKHMEKHNKEYVSMRHGKVVEVVDRPDLIIDETEE